MHIEFDDEAWPDLTRFRKACLADDVATMQAVVRRAPHWYPNENPESLPLSDIAKVYQAQHYASEGNLERLKDLQATAPWVLNHPWTAQNWLPLSQAVSAGADRVVVQFLLDQGADPQATVGSPDEQADVVTMARLGGFDDMADWLEEYAAARRRE